MQEVLKENNTGERTERSWEEKETWTFLQKSICRDNKIATDLIKAD